MGARAEEVSGQPAFAPSAPPEPTRRPLPHKGLELVMVRRSEEHTSELQSQ